MSIRATATLVFILAALLATYWLTGRIERGIIEETQRAKKLFDFSAEDITALSIVREGETGVEAIRADDGSWRIAAPFDHIPANGPLWTAITGTIAAMTNERTIDVTPADRDYFQLDSPLVSVVAATKQGPIVRLSLGAQDPTRLNRYAKLGDGQIFLTPAAAFASLNRGLYELRDRRAFTHLDKGISRMDYVRLPTSGADEDTIDDPDLRARAQAIDETYARDDEGVWHITSPFEALAHPRKLTALIRYLQGAAGRYYIDDPESLSDYGLDPPFARISVHADSGEVQTLLFGWLSSDEDNPGLFAKRADNPSIFIADAHLLTLLPAGPEDYRDKRLFTHEAKQLQTIRYKDSRSEIRLEYDIDKGWLLVEPISDDTDQLAVSMYIALLKRITGLSFPDVERVPSLDPPLITLDFTYSDDTPPTSIHIGAAVPGSSPLELYARQDFGVITTISTEAFAVLQVTPFDFRMKAVFPFRHEDVREIDLRFEGRHYVFRFSEGRWILVEPRNAHLETQSDVHALISAFMISQATGIADPPPAQDVQGLDEPLLEAVFEVVDERQTTTIRTFGPIRIGNRIAASSRQRFLSVEGKSSVYFTDQAIIDDVRAALQGVIIVDE